MNPTLTPAEHAAARLGATLAADREAIRQAAAETPPEPARPPGAPVIETLRKLRMRAAAVRAIVGQR